MKLSKIILLSFFCLCLAVSLFYTFKVFGAESKVSYITDYSVFKIDKEINTIVIEDGWNIFASLGPDAYLRSSRFYEFYMEADSVEKGALIETGENGYILNRYIQEFDDAILSRIELKGDSLIFNALSSRQASLLGQQRLRLNLKSIENINMKGDSYMDISGANSDNFIMLEKLDLKIANEAEVRIAQIKFDSLDIKGKDRSQITLLMLGRRGYVDTNGQLIEADNDRQLKLSSNIELSGMSKLNVQVGSVAWENLKLNDEAHIIFPSDQTIVVTKDGAKYNKR